MVEQSELIKRMIEANLSLEVNGVPDEENILKIIEFLKTAEEVSGRFKNHQIMIDNYTKLNCFDLAMLIKMVYEFNKSVKIVKLKSEVPFLTYRASVVMHIVIEFGGYYYDINGKHTKKQMEKYCTKEYSWHGMKEKVVGETELSSWMNTYQTTTSEFHKFCLSKIKKIYEQNSTSTNNTTNNTTV